MGEAKSTTRVPYAALSQILRAGRLATDGILEIQPQNGDGPTLRLRLVGGLLVDLETHGEPSLLGRSLLSSPSLRDRDLKRVRRDVAATDADIGQNIIEAGLLDDGEIARCIIAGLDTEFAPLFGHDDLVVLERTDSQLHSGLLGCIDLSLPIEEAILRASISADRWDVARELPLLHEVFGATSMAMEVFREPERFPEDAALLERFDGRLDLAEAIESGEFDNWEALARARDLLDGGYLESTNPVQLFQMGCEEERLGAFAKALRLFQHSDSLGLDDFDLGHRLAEVLQKVGRTEEALHYFKGFSEKCVSQFRIEDTIGVYAQILEIDTENLEIQEKYLSLLARYGRGDEALASGVELARRLQDSGDDTRARALLEQLVEQAEGNEEILRLYRDICLSTADPDGAASAARKLGALYLERGEFETALEVFQELFFQIGDDAGVRAKLIEIHFRLGNHDKASEHLKALHERSGWNARQPSEDAITFHRRLLDLEIEDSSITAWLSEAAKGQESREDSAHYLLRHRDLLREAGDLEGARLAAAELVRMRPEDLEATRTLSEIERRSGNTGRAGVVLEELLVRLAEGEAPPARDEWRALLEETLSVYPFSLIARRYLLETVEDGVETELRDRIGVELALLSVVAGDIEKARAELATIAVPPPISSVLEMCGGVLARGGRVLGEPPEDFFRRGAHHATETGDRGVLLDLVERLVQVAPSDPEIGKLRNGADRLRHSDGQTMGRAPAVVKSSISGITEKLRGLKDGPAGVSSKKSSGGVNAALARLKGLQGTGGAGGSVVSPAPGIAPSPSSSAGDDTLPPPPPPPAPAAAGGGVNAALARLKGLKGLGGGGTAVATEPPTPVLTPEREAPFAQGEGEDPAPLPPPPSPQAAGGGVNAALARLKGLQGLGGATPVAVVETPKDPEAPVLEANGPVTLEDTPSVASAPQGEESADDAEPDSLASSSDTASGESKSEAPEETPSASNSTAELKPTPKGTAGKSAEKGGSESKSPPVKSTKKKTAKTATSELVDSQPERKRRRRRKKT